MRSIIVSVCLFTLTACPRQAPAPVEDYGRNHYGKAYYPTTYPVGQEGPRQMPASVEIPEVEVSDAPSTVIGREYRVVSGDTLHGIARRYGSNVAAIATANRLSVPYAISPGQTLFIPGRGEIVPSVQITESVDTTTKPAKGAGQYVVESGDSLSMVAEKYGVSLPALAATNALESPYALRVGQTLLLPAGAQKREQQNSAASQKPSSGTYNPKKSPKSFNWPVQGKILSTFGSGAGSYRNDGINVSAASGTAIKAAAPGEVVYAGNGLKGYGNMIIIRHGGDYLTSYAHQQEFMVNKGDVVKAGQTIGKVGSTGNVDRPQLHFSIRKGTNAQDPKKYLK